MKKLMVFAALLTGISALAASEDKKLSYFENYPNNNQKLVFSIDAHCASSDMPIKVEEFYSQKDYPSTESKKMTPVRIVHIYVSADSEKCQMVSTKKIEKTFEIPTSKSMTHVYITSDPNVSIKSIQ